MVTVSVPGKIFLMGEHTVVHGKPALLSAVNLRLTVQIENSDAGIVIVTDEPFDYIAHALDIIRQHFGLEKLPGMKVTISSQIPSGYHLGSSAAVAVATVGASMFFLKKIWNPQLINQLAYEVEKKQHGNPSGGDNTAVTFGGFLWFRKELEFLKSIWQLPFKPHPSLNHFFLVNTGKPKETTGQMVALVSSKLKAQSSKMEKVFQENEKQTKRIAIALKDGDEDTLLDAIRIGERTLEDMGVVSKKVLPFIRSVEKLGGAAKILGGGGKTAGVGFLLCYHHKSDQVKKLALPYGFTIENITLGEEGVRLE